MPQSKEELDTFFSKPDPWEFLSNPDDITRKSHIITMASAYGPYSRALDLGAAEGWITQDLPAMIKHAYEISDAAAARMPNSVSRIPKPYGPYDLVIATGVLYAQYDWEHLVEIIRCHASKIVITCNIRDWEIAAAVLSIPGKEILAMTFPYRQYVQKLRVFDVSVP